MSWNKAPINGCPCYGCCEREISCHAKCERYKSWRQDMDKRREEEFRRKGIGGTMSHSATRQIWRKMRWNYMQRIRRSGQDR